MWMACGGQAVIDLYFRLAATPSADLASMSARGADIF